jgi:hypothetical protein
MIDPKHYIHKCKHVESTPDVEPVSSKARLAQDSFAEELSRLVDRVHSINKLLIMISEDMFGSPPEMACTHPVSGFASQPRMFLSGAMGYMENVIAQLEEAMKSLEDTAIAFKNKTYI